MEPEHNNNRKLDITVIWNLGTWDLAWLTWNLDTTTTWHLSTSTTWNLSKWWHGTWGLILSLLLCNQEIVHSGLRNIQLLLLDSSSMCFPQIQNGILGQKTKYKIVHKKEETLIVMYTQLRLLTYFHSLDNTPSHLCTVTTGSVPIHHSCLHSNLPGSIQLMSTYVLLW